MTNSKGNFEAKKSLGQHFLRSEKALQQMKDSVVNFSKQIKESEVVIFEIGPGEGVLTSKLLEYGGKVVVIEIDKRAIEFLKERFAEQIKNKKLLILEKDCLEVDYQKEISLTLFAQQGTVQYVLVGNIPYYITGAIFRHTFEQKVLPLTATFLVQKEVADRVVARDKKESILSISVKIFGDAKVVDIVKAGSFVPPPKVDSAILQISEIENPFKSKEEYAIFFEIMKSAFKQKRKYALSNIKNNLQEKLLDKYFDKLKTFIEEKQRAEDISLSTWKKIISEI